MDDGESIIGADSYKATLMKAQLTVDTGLLYLRRAPVKTCGVASLEKCPHYCPSPYSTVVQGALIYGLPTVTKVTV